MLNTTVFRGNPRASPEEVEGIKEGAREHIKEKEKNEKKLDELLFQSHTCLFQIKTVFPFDLFPDTLSVDPGKVDLIGRYFFASDVRTSIPIKDIKSVAVESNILFSTIKIIIDMPQDNSMRVGPLHRHDALRAKRIILGLNVCEKENVDISKIPGEELLAKAEELGKTKEI